MSTSRDQVLEALKHALESSNMTIIAEEDGTIRYATGGALGKLGLAQKESVTSDMLSGINAAIESQMPIQHQADAHNAVFSPVNGQGVVVISFDPLFPEEWQEEEYNRAMVALQDMKSRVVCGGAHA